MCWGRRTCCPARSLGLNACPCMQARLLARCMRRAHTAYATAAEVCRTGCFDNFWAASVLVRTHTDPRQGYRSGCGVLTMRSVTLWQPGAGGTGVIFSDRKAAATAVCLWHLPALFISGRGLACALWQGPALAACLGTCLHACMFIAFERPFWVDAFLPCVLNCDKPPLSGTVACRRCHVWCGCACLYIWPL
jgi:hypothetical protein